jgi:selenide,water dikinase
VRADLEVGHRVADELVTLVHDPQTSGGLLAAVPADALDRVLSDLDASGGSTWPVGRVEEGSGVALR